MKKILSLFAVFGLILGTSTSVVSCKKIKLNEDNNDQKEKEEKIKQIIDNFKEKVNEKWKDNINNENIQKKLTFFVDKQKDEKYKYKFINEKNLKKFSNTEAKLSDGDKKILKDDIYEILNITNFKNNLKELKKDKDFEIILNEIDEIFDGINILYDDNFKITYKEFGEKEKDERSSFISNIYFNYEINFFYKNNNKTENYKLNFKFEFICTSSEIFYEIIENFKNNVAKDLFLDEKNRELINFCWTGNQQVIKDNQKDYEGYGKFSNWIKNYINNKDQESDLLKIVNFIEEKYFFKNSYLNIEIVPDKKETEICKFVDFKNNFINVFENKNSYQFVRYDNNANSENSAKSIFKVIFRNDPMEDQNYKDLKNLYFNKTNLEKWNNEFLEIKNKYLKNELKLDEDDIKRINKWDQYKNADSIGKIKICGLKLKIKFNDNDNPNYFNIPSFDLFSIYNVVGKNNMDYWETKSKLLSEFTSKKLIKSFQDFFGIQGDYPEYNSYNDYLFNISNIEVINILKEYMTEINSWSWGSLIQLFHYLNLYNMKEEREFNNLKNKLLENIIGLISKENIRYNYFSYYDYSSKNNQNSGRYNKYKDDRHPRKDAFFNNEIELKIDDSRVKIVEASNSCKDKNPDAITFKLGYLAVKIKYEQLFELGNKDRMFIKFC